MVPDHIAHEVDIDAPVERVWQLLTEPEHVRVWYAFDGAEIDLRPGGAVVYRWEEHGEFHGVIERVEPPHVYVVRHAHVPGVHPQPGNSTLVEYTLTPSDTGTHLRVVERGFRDLAVPAEEQAASAQINVQGWTGGLALLRDHARHVAT